MHVLEQLTKDVLNNFSRNLRFLAAKRKLTVGPRSTTSNVNVIDWGILKGKSNAVAIKVYRANLTPLAKPGKGDVAVGNRVRLDGWSDNAFAGRGRSGSASLSGRGDDSQSQESECLFDHGVLMVWWPVANQLVPVSLG